MQAAGQLFCQSMFTGVVQMTIDVRCHLNVAVSHPFLHILEVAAVVQKQTGAAVSKLVKTDVRKTMLFQKVVAAGFQKNWGKIFHKVMGAGLLVFTNQVQRFLRSKRALQIGGMIASLSCGHYFHIPLAFIRFGARADKKQRDARAAAIDCTSGLVTRQHLSDPEIYRNFACKIRIILLYCNQGGMQYAKYSSDF